MEQSIRHINPLMFGVIDDKPEDVARGRSPMGLYTIKSIMRGFMCYKSEGNFARGVYNSINATAMIAICRSSLSEKYQLGK